MCTSTAVIYDMDGVLIDSEPLWQEAEKLTFSEVGFNLSTADCLQTKGMRIDEVVGFWFQKKPWEHVSQSDIVSNILDKMIDLIQMKGECMEGVVESIEFFQSKKMPLAIATSSPNRIMKATLNHLGLYNYFPIQCSAEFEEYGKPHPAIYLTAAKQLVVNAESCLVIEDSISGMRSAMAANMNVVVIPERAEFDKEEWLLADYKFNSLNKMVEYFKNHNL